jgi:hypothetical protein
LGARDHGLREELEAFAEERSVVAAALTYCDLTTSTDGAPITVTARLAVVVARYGPDHPVARAIRRSRQELLDRSQSVERALRSRSRG